MDSVAEHVVGQLDDAIAPTVAYKGSSGKASDNFTAQDTGNHLA
jgi:hypothetical protein